MKYKAIFFDRDGTITYFCKEKELWRDSQISEWSGKQFELPYEKMMKLFNLASEGKKLGIKHLMMNVISSKDIIDIYSLKRVLYKTLKNVQRWRYKTIREDIKVFRTR